MSSEPATFSSAAPSAAAAVASADDLLRMALARPTEAVRRASALLDSRPGPYLGSVALQARGIVLRDSGDIPAALRELRLALRLAHSSAEQQRVADVLATLGAALVMAGASKRGFAHLRRAAELAHGETLARVHMRHAFVLTVAGRYAESLTETRRALDGIRRTGDVVWEARALNSRALTHIAMGAVARAERDILRAQELFAATGQELEAAFALQNRGVIAYGKGDLPDALRLYDLAAQRYADLGAAAPDLAIDRCTALHTAGLAQEAVDVVARELDTATLQASKRAELILTLAVALLTVGNPEPAIAHASHAAAMFRAQHRRYWTLRATVTAVQASYRAGICDPRLLGRAAETARGLEEFNAEEAVFAHLLTARLALQRDHASHREHLLAAARYRNRGAPLTRATGWLAQALLGEASGQARLTLIACARGLDELDAHCSSFGSSELRALGTAHGTELARIALRHATRRGDPRTMLWWSERWRATSLKLPPVRPPTSRESMSELAALRDAVRRLGDARAIGAPTAAIERERAQWERVIREKRHTLAGPGGSGSRFDLTALMPALGSACFVELVEVDDILHALVLRDGRVRKEVIGGVAVAERLVEQARFALRGISRGRPVQLAGLGQRLEAALLGPARRHLGDDAVVVSPPSRFHTTPWSLLPSLAGRPVSVTPSAALWLRARATRPPSTRRVVLVLGPGLDSGDVEVTHLARRYPDAEVLRDGSATVERALEAMDGAWLVHVAAHGEFRPDSPLFSCMHLDDGPLTVHDLERLNHAPYRFLLSACDSGVGSPAGAEELLGMVSALTALGTVGIASSVTQVNDAATVPFMLDVHAGLGRGHELAGSLASAVESAQGDPAREAIAASFVALGV